jgi:UDP-N-acetylmuramate dehydrogenase
MDSFKDITTFRVGGAIGHLARAGSVDEFVHTLAELAEKKEKFLIVGAGSNLLPHDGGFDGTVVIPEFRDVSFMMHSDTVEVRADAGASWDAVIAQSVARGLWGIENLSGIPGTVGGAAVANIGAYGAALSDVFVSADIYDVGASVRRALARAGCGFGYRTSVFKKNPERYAILSVTLALSKTAKPNLSYRDLAVAFPSGAASLADIRSAVLAIRATKFPPLADYGTAGSFFLNPIVTREDVARIEATYPGMPVFELPEGGIKLPLAWILDRVVHAKGMRVGGAFVWEAQPLVIAAERGASSYDVRTLAQKIADTVKTKTDLMIIPEVRVLEK